MVKKYSCLFLSLLLMLSLAGCGSATSDSASEEPTQTQTESVTEAATESASENADTTVVGTEQGQAEQDTEIKAAVVYFSATGNTEAVAELIAAETGADIFEIVPETEYTDDDLNYSDDSCRANQEMDDDTARPAISSELSAVSEYDVIYLGHPIWWGTAPRIIQTFLESYDLSQATIYTFCTSGSSGIEGSVSDLQELYPELQIVSGRRFSGADEDEVREWISELGVSDYSPAYSESQESTAEESNASEENTEAETSEPEQRLISVTFGDASVIYELNDGSAADSLYEMLPLTVQVEDYSTNEKIFYPAQELDTSDAPLAQAGAGTLAYYAPWGDVVFFYGDYNENSGLFELGQAVSGAEQIDEMSGTITIEAVA